MVGLSLAANGGVDYLIDASIVAGGTATTLKVIFVGYVVISAA